MHSVYRRLYMVSIVCACLFMWVAVSACARAGMSSATMAPFQRLASPTITVGLPQPFIVGRPYSLDGSDDGGDLIMISTTQFELIGHAQYAPIAGGSFDTITCGAIKLLTLTHPAGPIDVQASTPLAFKTNHDLYAKVMFLPHNGTIAISAVIYPTCAG